MGIVQALIAAAGLGLAAAALIALPRRPLVPVVVTLVGMASLVVLAISWGSQPCQTDPAGCGMQRGFEGMILWAVGALLAVGVLAAIGWRVVAGRDAKLKARILALITGVLLGCLVGIGSTF
ncbi:MAG: hypothetical protein VX874_20870 [Pseudomonadota bacterium]|nr:hypothetical protein [Pseudomonadota bacterium]